MRAVRRCRFVFQARPVAGRPAAPANRRAGIAKAGGRRFGGGAHYQAEFVWLQKGSRLPGMQALSLGADLQIN